MKLWVDKCFKGKSKLVGVNFLIRLVGLRRRRGVFWERRKGLGVRIEGRDILRRREV